MWDGVSYKLRNELDKQTECVFSSPSDQNIRDNRASLEPLCSSFWNSYHREMKRKWFYSLHMSSDIPLGAWCIQFLFTAAQRAFWLKKKKNSQANSRIFQYRSEELRNPVLWTQVLWRAPLGLIDIFSGSVILGVFQHHSWHHPASDSLRSMLVSFLQNDFRLLKWENQMFKWIHTHSLIREHPRWIPEIW